MNLRSSNVCKPHKIVCNVVFTPDSIPMVNGLTEINKWVFTLFSSYAEALMFHPQTLGRFFLAESRRYIYLSC